jgi:hypothetical protein
MGVLIEKDPLTFFSFGGGRQSTAIALLLIYHPEKFTEKGLTIPQNINFADTGAEPQPVYDHIEKMSKLLTDNGYQFNICKRLDKDGNFTPLDDINSRASTVPFFTRSPEGVGMLKRQCTNDFKIQPLTKSIRKSLGYKPRQKVKDEVKLWLGISTDESQRMRTNKVNWITNVYPLIGLGLSASHCTALGRHYLGYAPPKSACYFCPFTNHERWLSMRQNDPETFQKAVEFDRKVRDLPKVGKSNYPCYIHSSGTPLESAVLDQPFIPGLFHSSELRGFLQECEGHCGV